MLWGKNLVRFYITCILFLSIGKFLIKGFQVVQVKTNLSYLCPLLRIDLMSESIFKYMRWMHLSLCHDSIHTTYKFNTYWAHYAITFITSIFTVGQNIRSMNCNELLLQNVNLETSTTNHYMLLTRVWRLFSFGHWLSTLPRIKDSMKK